MADISKVTLPNGSTYDIKDATARNQVTAEATARQNADTTLTNQINTLKSNLTGAMHYAGVTTTPIRDGVSVNASNTTDKSITINNTTYVPKPGDVVIYENKEFVYWETTSGEGTVKVTEGHWNEFGSTGSLKALAFKDSASGTTTPTGTVSRPTFTGIKGNIEAHATGIDVASVIGASVSNTVASYSTNGYPTIRPDKNETVVQPTVHVSGGSATTNATKATIKQVSGVGTLPSFTASVTNEILSLAFSAGSLPTTSDASVVTEVSSAYTNPKIEVSPFIITIDILGDDENIPVTGTFTPQGTISQPTFTGDAATVTVK